MASSNLTKPKELGKYNESSSCGVGGAKPKHGARNKVAEEMCLARECGGCGKHIKKGKMKLMCSCKLVIYCCEDCKVASSHNCWNNQPIDKTANAIIQACEDRYKRDRAAGRAPSSDGVKKLAKMIGGNEGRLLPMAEKGDPLAAFIIGSAYLERRVRKGSKGSSHECFSMPSQYLEKSILETNEMAVKWLKVAAEGGVPEAMFLLYRALVQDCGMEVDGRVAVYWLEEAYRTGKMDYLVEILEYGGYYLAGEFGYLSDLVHGIENRTMYLSGPSLRQLLLATRWQELKLWGGKTAMGEPFYGWVHFKKFMEKVGGLEMIKQAEPSLASAEEKSIQFVFVSGRPGSSDELIRNVVSRERKESNLKFKQGVKQEVNLDFQLVLQGIFPADRRTSYLVTCKHNQVQGLERAQEIEGPPGSKLGIKDQNVGLRTDHGDHTKYKRAGNCQPCKHDAHERLRSVARGRYSISVTQVIPNHSHAARYVDGNGVVVQDVFKSYSKPDLRQVLQCLMTNPADLHPLAVAEDQSLYWGIIWYWGSVYQAVQDTCDHNTLAKIYGNLNGNIADDRGTNSACSECRSANVSGLAAFPESAVGEWRIACGNELCPMVDHEIKFNLCAGCKVRRYCNEVCQRKDWPKHKEFCKAAK